MAYIIVEKDEEQMRSNMRDNMRRTRSGRLDGTMPMMRREDGNMRDYYYRMGYRHGWEDSEDDMQDEHYRRYRDSRGRFM